MAIGNQPSSSFQVNSMAAQLAIQLRTACQAIITFQEWTTSQGETGLQNIGFSSNDAVAMIDQANYMATVAGVYYGTVQQGGSGGINASEFNFSSALIALTGPT